MGLECALGLECACRSPPSNATGAHDPKPPPQAFEPPRARKSHAINVCGFAYKSVPCRPGVDEYAHKEREAGMSDLIEPARGLTRRDVMRRGAVTAGALMWAAPTVQAFARPAFGQTDGTPVGFDFSYIALFYECGGETFAIKFEFKEGPDIDDCEPWNENQQRLVTPHCQFPLPPGVDASDVKGDETHCNEFDISFPNGDLTKVRVCLNGALITMDCVISSVGVGFCGLGHDGPPCVPGTPNGNCLVFDMCGV